MRIFFIFIAGFLLHTLFTGYTSGGVGINLMLLLTVEISLIRGKQQGQVFGFFSGLVEDILSMGLLGEKVLIRTVIGNLLGRFKNHITVGHFIFQIFITFIIFFVHSYAIYFVRLIFSYPSSISVSKVIVYSIVNSLLAPVVYVVVKKTIAR
ncbi:MAG: rod shape-determining protein MreD [Elusimicrobiota bacterium]